MAGSTTKAAPKARRGADAAVPAYGSIGSTGLNQTGGFVHEEFLRELSGLLGARVYREMSDNDPTVGASLFVMKTLLRRMKWSFQPVNETEEAKVFVSFAEEVLEDMETPFDSVIEEACSMFEYGFAPMELIYKRRGGPDETDPTQRSKFTDGRVGLRSISLRKQTTVTKWVFDDEDGSILGLWQQPLAKPSCFIPMEKLALFRTTDRLNNPEGRSLLRNAYRPWYFKKRIEELEAIGAERDLAGLPVVYIPGNLMKPDADARDKQAVQGWQKMVSNIKRDRHEGIVMPLVYDAKGNQLYKIELLSTAGSRVFNTNEIIGRYDKAIATTVLADFIFLGQQAVGSFALSSDKTALFAEALGAFATVIASQFNLVILPRLWRLNGLPHDLMPTMVPGDLEKPDLAVLGTYLNALSTSGAMLFPDRQLEEHLREAAGLPLPPEEGEDMRYPDPLNPETDPAEQGEVKPQDEE